MTQPFPLLRRPLNFLLVDDDDICLFIHRRVLELTDYCRSVHSASNGKTALEILQRAAMGAMPLPDIILLDLDMPLMNGLGFLDAFNKIGCVNKGQIAVVLLTSSVSEKDKEYAFTHGASEWIAKPLTKEALNALVSRLYANGVPPPLMQACM